MKSEGLLSIYVGRFETHITSIDIASHIMGRTKIKDKRLFNVEQLIGQKNEMKQKTFVSFKISTLSDDIYKMLLNNDVWGPNQSARPFKTDSPKFMNRRDYNGSQSGTQFANFNGRKSVNRGYQHYPGSFYQRNDFRRPNRYNEDRSGWRKSNAPYIPRFERENRKYYDEREKHAPNRKYDDQRYDNNRRNNYQSQEDERKSRQDNFFDQNY